MMVYNHINLSKLIKYYSKNGWVFLHVNYNLMKLIKNILKTSKEELEDKIEETYQILEQKA